MGFRAKKGDPLEFVQTLDRKIRDFQDPVDVDVEDAAFSEAERQMKAATIPRDSGDTEDSLVNREHSLNISEVRGDTIVWGTRSEGGTYRPKIVPSIDKRKIFAAIGKALNKRWLRRAK